MIQSILQQEVNKEASSWENLLNAMGAEKLSEKFASSISIASQEYNEKRLLEKALIKTRSHEVWFELKDGRYVVSPPIVVMKEGDLN